MQPCNRIYYSKIHWRLTIFRAAFHSSSGAPNCICSLWYIYSYGDRPLSRLGGNSTTGHHMRIQTRGSKHSLELLMMSEMRIETCWAFNKFWNNKFYYKVASCWLCLLIHTTMHGSINIKFTKQHNYKEGKTRLEIFNSASVSYIKKINCLMLHLVGQILEYYYDARTHKRKKRSSLSWNITRWRLVIIGVSG